VFLLPLHISPSLSSSSTDTVRNRSPTIEINCYRPKLIADGRNRPLPPDSGRQWSKSTVTDRQRSMMVEIDRYQSISGGNGRKQHQSTVLPGRGRSEYRQLAIGMYHSVQAVSIGIA
ncbi:hypothetical protein B296_00044938, partial [Ensete ventricosum]